MFKKILKWFGIILAALILLPLLAWGLFHLSEYASGGKYVSYLEENNETVALGEDFSFGIMDGDISNSKLILLGEIHGFHEPQAVDLNLFKHLHQNHGVRNYVAELDFVQSLLLNGFLESGNEEVLAEVLKNWVVIQGRENQSYFDKFLGLKNFYQSLPADQKFRFLGIDKIQDMDLTSQFLIGFAPEKTWSVPTQNPDSLITQIDSLNILFVGSPDTLQILRHIRTNLEFVQNEENREEVLFQNFSALYKDLNLQNEKLYGYFGLYHVFQYRVNGKKPFAAKVRESDLGLEGKMLSLNFMMNESYMVMPTKEVPEFMRSEGPYSKMPISADNLLFMYFYGVKDYKRVCPENHKSIFKLNQPDNPYGESDRMQSAIQLIPVADMFEMTDKGEAYVQYTIFVRGSDWAVPME